MTRIIDILMSRGALVAIAFAGAVGLAYESYFLLLERHGNVGCLNWMNITVTVAVITGLYLARQIDVRMKRALDELWLQGTLQYVIDPTDDLQQRILKKHRLSEMLSALLFMSMMVVVYTPFYGQITTILFDPNVLFQVKRRIVMFYVLPIIIGIVTGFVAGAFFGRLATYGSMASVLADLPELIVRPTHFDRANGFRPVGNFYLYQAVLTAIPLLWLAGWAFFYPRFAEYQRATCDVEVMSWFTWQAFGQWLLVATFTYIGFVRPVLALRRRLIAARVDLLQKRLPAIEVQIQEMRQKLQEPLGEGARAAFENRLHDLAHEHWSIRTMGVWPMDIATLRKYVPIEIGTKLAPLVLGPLFSKGGQEASWVMSPFQWVAELVRAIFHFEF